MLGVGPDIRCSGSTDDRASGPELTMTPMRFLKGSLFADGGTSVRFTHSLSLSLSFSFGRSAQAPEPTNLQTLNPNCCDAHFHAGFVKRRLNNDLPFTRATPHDRHTTLKSSTPEPLAQKTLTLRPEPIKTQKTSSSMLLVR